METLKSIASNLLCDEFKVSLTQIEQYVITGPAALFEYAKINNIPIEEPQIWEYIGADGNPETLFTLRYGYKTNASGNNKIKQLTEFEYLSFTHEGKWNTLSNTYSRIIPECLESGFKLSGICRELYWTIDLNTPENNRTEIQIGVNKE